MPVPRYRMLLTSSDARRLLRALELAEEKLVGEACLREHVDDKSEAFETAHLRAVLASTLRRQGFALMSVSADRRRSRGRR